MDGMTVQREDILAVDWERFGSFARSFIRLHFGFSSLTSCADCLRRDGGDLLR